MTLARLSASTLDHWLSFDLSVEVVSLTEKSFVVGKTIICALADILRPLDG